MKINWKAAAGLVATCIAGSGLLVLLLPASQSTIASMVWGAVLGVVWPYPVFLDRQ